MKLRSAWRSKKTLTFSGNETYYYYTNAEYNSYKAQGYDMSVFQRVFIMTNATINEYPAKYYSAFFPPF